MMKRVNIRLVIVTLLFIVLASTAYYLFVSMPPYTPVETVMPQSVAFPLPSSSPATESAEVNYKATFAIYTNGTFRVFTDSRYHNKSEEVFIDPASPNVVVVKKRGTTWDDFFKTLPMEVRSNCLVTGTKQTLCTTKTQTLKFYINGELVTDFLNHEIKDGDKVLISYGPASDPAIKNQLKRLDTLK